MTFNPFDSISADLLTNGPCGLHSIDKDGLYCYINDTELAWIGYSREEIIGKMRITDLMTPKNKDKFKSHYATFMQQGNIKDVESEILTKNGTIKTFLVSSRALYDESHIYKMSSSIVVDISEIKQAEESLRKNDEWLKSLINLAVDAILLGDPAGKIIDANLCAAQLTGYDKSELIGRNISMLFSLKEQKLVPLRYDLLKKGLVVRNERILSRKNGSTLVVEMNTKMMPDGTYQAFIRDMTERKRVEDALRVSEEKFSKAFKTSPDSININRLSDGIYIDINEGFTAITGYTLEDVVGKSSLPGDLGIWVNKEDRDKLLKGLEKDGVVKDLDAPFCRKDGTILRGLMSARIIEINGVKCILSTTRDITEKQKVDAALQNTQKLEALGVLAGGIAHDFNNLLVGLFGYIDLAKHSSDIGPQAQSMLSQALEVSKRATSLTKQLLTFAKGGVPVKKVMNISALLSSTAKFALSGSNIRSDIIIAPDLLSCEIDEHQIGQVIDNLLINARQAMPLGGIIVISARNTEPNEKLFPNAKQKTYIRIAIKDQGTGIPLEIQARIFDPFFTTKQQGSGLGLATAYSIIHKHEGWISVESEPGKGSTFVVYLPASAQNIQSGTSSTGLSNKTKAGRILLMDDESVVRQVAGSMLKSMGHDVVFSIDGSEAVDIFRRAKEANTPFDAVILDLTIPGGMGGKQTIEILLSIDPTVRAIASSGYSDDPVMADPTKFKFVNAIAKPYITDELEEVVNTVLRNSKNTKM